MAHEEESRLIIGKEGDVEVVQLLDRKILDEVGITQIGDELKELVAKSDHPKLVMDFTNVGHMSSAALGMLIALHKRIRQSDGQLKLCGIQPTIYEVFVITRLNEIFEIHSTRQEALASFE